MNCPTMNRMDQEKEHDHDQEINGSWKSISVARKLLGFLSDGYVFESPACRSLLNVPG